MSGLGGKRVLVAGSTGLIGSNLLERLLGEGATVRATIHHHPPVIEDARVDYAQCDLTRSEDCKRSVEGMEYVFVCAASTSAAATVSAAPVRAVTRNAMIDVQLLEAAYAAGVRKFVWLGSTLAYPASDTPVREEDILSGEPYEKYFCAGWGKRFGEVLCRIYGQMLPRPMTTIVLRPTYVYGPRDDFELATCHVIPALIRKTVERWDPIVVWGDGSEVRDAVYVDDVVDAMVAAAAKLDVHAALNVGLGKGYSVRELLGTILDIDGYRNARIQYDESKPTTIPSRLVDTGREQVLLGTRVHTCIKEGLRRTLEWYRATRRLPRPRATG